MRFGRFRRYLLGRHFRKVEAGPLVRSSYHAEQAWAAAAVDNFFPRGTRRSLPIND